MGNIADLYGGQAFDPSEHEQQQNFDPLPPGWYTVSIKNAEVKDTKAGNGKYLALALEIQDEAHNGRLVFSNINLVNPNPQSVEIGQRELASMVAALGMAAVSDTDELLGKSALVKLKIGKPRDGYEPENEVSAWKPLSGGQKAASLPASAPPSPTPAAPAAAVATPAAASSGGKRPWER